MGEKESNVRLSGHAIAQGLAIGQAFLYREKLEALAESYWIEEHQVEEELRRLERAIEVVAQDLQVSAQRIESAATAKLGAIFEAHAVMLQDPALREEVQNLVTGDLIRAEHALARAFGRREKKFRQMTEAKPRQYADDVADLAQRLLREMAGIKVTSLEKMPPGRVLVARRLLPSDTIALPRRAVAGIVAEFGGPGSHVALLAEALGIPTVAQIPNLLQRVREDDLLLVDGFRGEVVLNPDTVTRARYREETRGAQARRRELRHAAGQPARTRDGITITVMANVSCREDAAAAAQNGADGVGLYRLEGFYLARKTPPTMEELLAELRALFTPIKDKPVTVRLLDIGGDKPLPFLKLPHENNPFLGQRGVRFLLRYPDLLDTQLQALCRFAQEQEVNILVPMVTFAEDMARVRRRLEAAANALALSTLPRLGAMVETPSAALTVPEIRTHADFLSIGTNDLTQYTVAAGRENPLVHEYFREDHPAVLRLLRIVVDEAGPLPVTVCGELARETQALPALLGLGIRNLSVAAPLIPEVKEAIRQIRAL